MNWKYIYLIGCMPFFSCSSLFEKNIRVVELLDHNSFIVSSSISELIKKSIEEKWNEQVFRRELDDKFGPIYDSGTCFIGNNDFSKLPHIREIIAMLNLENGEQLHFYELDSDMTCYIAIDTRGRVTKGVVR